MSLHVERLGQGPDLVLLHGWGMHSGVWKEAMPRLTARFTVHAIDLPGHGHSSRVPVGGLDAAVDAVAAAIEHDAIVCGWSLGGLLAQRLARRHAGRVRALVLASTTPSFVARSGWLPAMEPQTLERFAAGLISDRDATLASFVKLNAINGTGGREAIRVFTQRLGERGLPNRDSLQATLGWIRDSDLRDTVPAIATPTLVIHGGRDMLTPIGAGRWLAANIPGARLVELVDCAHLPFYTHRDAFVGALESFVG